MTKKPKKRDPRTKGRYRIVRDAEGRTPRQRLDMARAEAVEFENKRQREKWQTKEEAVAKAQEAAEMIQGDLYGTIPLALAGKLSGRVFTPAEVRIIVRAEVDAMVRGWIRGEYVSASSIPSNAPKPKTKGHSKP